MDFKFIQDGFYILFLAQGQEFIVALVAASYRSSDNRGRDEREDVERHDVHQQHPCIHLAAKPLGSIVVYLVLEAVQEAVQDVLYGGLQLPGPLGMGQDLVDDEPRQLPVGGDEVEMPFYALADSLLQGQVLVADGAQDDVAQLAYLVRDNAFEEVVLRAEVVVEHGVGHSRRFGDGGGPGSGIAFLEKLPFGGLQDAGFRVLAVALFFAHIIIKRCSMLQPTFRRVYENRLVI